MNDAFNAAHIPGYRVTFTPTAPGDYLISIKFAGTNIAGSPFKCTVAGKCRPLPQNVIGTCPVQVVVVVAVQ